jgi:hypothetical protein
METISKIHTSECDIIACYVSVSVQIASFDEKSHNQARDPCKMNILLDHVLPKLQVNKLQSVGAGIS